MSSCSTAVGLYQTMLSLVSRPVISGRLECKVTSASERKSMPAIVSEGPAIGAFPMGRAIGYVGYVLIAVDVALLIRAIRPIGGDCITNAATAVSRYPSRASP